MPIPNPAAFHAQFVDAFNAGKIDDLMAMYTADAVLVPAPNQPATGQDAIRAALGQFLALRGTIDLKTTYVVEAGETALTRSEWVLKGTGADSSPVEMASSGIEVFRRQSDGNWLVVIDAPFGAGS